LDIVMYCQTDGDERLACAQAGCEDCLKALLLENENLIWAVTRAQRFGLAEYAELRQEGRIGFWLAVKHYDPRRGVCFSTFAWQIIRRRIWAAVAQVSKTAGWLEAGTAQDQMGIVIETWQTAQIRAALDEGLACLSEQQRRIIILHYGWDSHAPQSFTEIAKTLGLTRQRMHQICHEALVLLRAPALSICLRGICEQDNRANYRRALRQNREKQRKYRGRG
jgi:RNA polymerase sigma factor (sigma-70 family)